MTAGVVALGTAAVTTAANFETAMSSVKALISSSSTDIEGDMEKLEEAARSAGETTKFSATEAAEAMSYMGLAGWTADEMCEGLSGILNLAAASEMDLATASDIVTDYLSAFGLTVADSEMLVDKMAYAMSNSNTSTEQLGEAYKNCAATSTQLGYGLDETTAALMVMADAGIKGGEAGTALSSIMTRLGNNTSGCTDLLAEYGIEVYDAEGNVNSLSNIFSGMQDIWADLTDEEKANLAYVVAGKTAQSELMTVLGETTGSFQEYQEGLAGCSGTAEDICRLFSVSGGRGLNFSVVSRRIEKFLRRGDQ
ncbi:MAG: phage tail tape measure protein [Clostridiales bacterium]|nr:phage tail tape measure protein [Clostridiales bacterium]